LIPSPGIWLINYTFRLTAPNNNGIIARFYSSIGSTGATPSVLLGVCESSATQAVNSNTSASNCASGVVNVTNSNTYIFIYVVLGITAGPITSNNVDSYMQITRIG